MSEGGYSVGEDPGLAPEEKQVSFVSAKADDTFRVHSEVSSLTQRLLAHPEFDEERRRMHDGEIVAVTGLIPIQCLKVSEEPRKNGRWAPIVSSGVLDRE